MDKYSQIPEITDRELVSRALIAKPCMFIEQEIGMDEVWSIGKQKDLRKTSFTWDAKKDSKIGMIDGNFHGVYEYADEKVDNNGGRRLNELYEVYTFVTLHTFAYYGFFKPTIAEVLSQLPKDLFDDNEEFFFTTKALGLADNNVSVVGDYQVAKTYVLIPVKKEEPVV